jgi:hypothetical protein
VVEECALADAGLAAQDDDAASSGKRVGDEPIERFALAATTEQPRGLAAIPARVRSSWPVRRPSVVVTSGSHYFGPPG